MSKTQLPFSDDVINLFIFQNENKKNYKKSSVQHSVQKRDDNREESRTAPKTFIN